MSQIHLSVLDLCPILSGETPTESLSHVGDLARHVESLNFDRYWVAEHHDMEGIGSSAPEVLIPHIAGLTKKMRIGSGGIMLPNHATFHIAEVFRTLEALYPGRIDLGLGRAPGSGSRATVALRGHNPMAAEKFPEEIELLEKYFADELPLKAIPTRVGRPDIWILGSSDFGARLAAQRGLPYSFAQHFSGFPATEVLNLYKRSFEPSEHLSEPLCMMGCHIICAETDEEAEKLAHSSDLSYLRFIQGGPRGFLPDLKETEAHPLSPIDRQHLRTTFPKFIGSPKTIKKYLEPYTRAGIDNFMILSMIYDQELRRKSYTLIREIL